MILKNIFNKIQKKTRTKIQNFSYKIQQKIVRNSGFFNSNDYLDMYQDLENYKADLVNHYVLHGWREGRSPSKAISGADLKYHYNTKSISDKTICPLVKHFFNPKKNIKSRPLDTHIRVDIKIEDPMGSFSLLHSKHKQVNKLFEKSNFGKTVIERPFGNNFLEKPKKTKFVLELYQMLKDVTEVLSESNIEYFSVFGTLLGTIRHGGLIPWDDDLDLGIIFEDIEKCLTVLNKNLNRIYKIEYPVISFTKDILVIQISKIVRCNGINCKVLCDIFPMKIKNSNIIGPFFEIPHGEIFPTSNSFFGNVQINIPNNFELLLNIIFDSYWKTHAKKFNHYSIDLGETDFLKHRNPESTIISDIEFLPLGPFGPLKKNHSI